ncbi:MAG: type II secretion system F family protein, partial [Planctomycetes bacterium]|nr:type II secretion system F family protein [Planctomycetota bacterium]
PVFAFEAIKDDGQKVKSEVTAGSKDEAIRKIQDQGLRPTRIKAQKEESKSRSVPGVEKAPAKKKGGLFMGGVSSKDIVTFTTQLSTLQDAGLPIVRSLKILEEQQKPGRFKDQLEEVSSEVEQGSTLSEAMAKYPKSFDKLYISMVKAGEAGGVLDVILRRLAGFMEKSQKLRKQVKGALIYPAAVITVAILILVVIMLFVVPAFEKMFADIGQALPAPTQLLLNTSQAIQTYWYLIPLIPIFLMFIMKMIARTEAGERWIDAFKLRMPVFGNIIKKSSVARFCRTLGTLIASGVPILEALRIVKDAVGNVIISNAIEDVHGSIREGDTIADPLRASGIFDELLVNMIDVGEETGELDKMLMKIADNYEADVDVAVEGMSSLLEPLLIVGMGLVVGFIVISLFLPLVSIIKNIG